MKLLNGNIVTNFSYNEIACNDDHETVILNAEVINHAQNLQKFREWYNRPMQVTSWYRTPAYNKKVGGSPKSQHLDGVATDFLLPTDFSTFSNKRKDEFIKNCRNKWHEICKNSGGFGIYDTFIHLDSRTTKSDFDYRN